jgi:ABC-type dipeptide/oligopeptide/nickel transport system permease component
VVIVFVLMHLIPGNPWNNFSESMRILPNIASDPNLENEMNRRFRFDLPLWQQFTNYVIGSFDEGGFQCGAICGNLGPSTAQRGRMVQDVLFKPPEGKLFWFSQFGYSLRLVLLASVMAFGLGILLGLWMGLRPEQWTSRWMLVGVTALTSIPHFILGLLAILIFALGLRMISVVPNWEIPSDWIIPAAVLAAIPMANLSRVVRTAILNITGEDYIRTARAKGLTKVRIMLAHLLLNAMLPILAFSGSVMLELFTGLVVIEALYGFPGIGREYWEAILQLNYPMVFGLTLVFACIIVLVNFVIDIASRVIDPRIIEPAGGSA